MKPDPDAHPSADAATEISSDGSSNESETESAEMRKAAAAYAVTTGTSARCGQITKVEMVASTHTPARVPAHFASISQAPYTQYSETVHPFQPNTIDSSSNADEFSDIIYPQGSASVAGSHRALQRL